MKHTVCSVTNFVRLAGEGQNQTRFAGGRLNQSRTPARPCSMSDFDIGGMMGAMAIGWLLGIVVLILAVFALIKVSSFEEADALRIKSR